MTPARLLIVEDEGLFAEDLRQQLLDLGHQVAGVVVAGEDVLRAVEETGPDLVLMDIHLKNRIDGISAAEQLRARFDLPVIYVTAYADDDILQRARQTEPLGYLVKPIRRIELKVTLEMALHKRSLEVRMRGDEDRLRAIGHLAGGIAHDFNNLMTAVLGYSDYLLSTWPADHPDREAVEQIPRAAERTALLTSRLLAFARRDLLRLEDIDLNGLIDNLHARFARCLPAGTQMTVTLAPGPLPVRADPRKLEDVLADLVLDRLGALPQGGRITIHTAPAQLSEPFFRLHPELRPGRYAEVVIEDSSAGLGPEQLRRLFEPTLKLREHPRVGDGSGMAVPAAYGTIRQLGGHIFPDSAPGRGTWFRILLPQPAQEEKEQP